jgi:hypothetical protein
MGLLVEEFFLGHIHRAPNWIDYTRALGQCKGYPR